MNQKASIFRKAGLNSISDGAGNIVCVGKSKQFHRLLHFTKSTAYDEYIEMFS